MNVVFLTSISGPGGSPSTAFHTAKLLHRMGHRALLFAPGEYWIRRGVMEHLPVRNDLELRRGFRPLSFWRDWKRLRAAIRELDIHAVVVQKSPEQWLAFFALMGLKKKVALVRLRGVVFPIKKSIFNRWLHNHMQLVVSSASCIQRHFATLRGFRQDTVKLILEGVDTQRFHPASPEERAAARRKFNIEPGDLVIGTAGRPAPVKGHDLLLKAFAQAVSTRNDERIKLVIFSDQSRVGGGSYKEHEIRDMALQHGIGSQFEFYTEPIKDMAQVYHALDVYVLPSRGSEGSSRAGLEASASGLPFIAGSVGVLPDLVEHGTTGRLVAPDNIELLAAELGQLMDEWPRAQAWGQAARARMETQFSEERYGTALATALGAAVTTVQGDAEAAKPVPARIEKTKPKDKP